MNSTKITISEATPVPTTVRGNSATGGVRAAAFASVTCDRRLVAADTPYAPRKDLGRFHVQSFGLSLALR